MNILVVEDDKHKYMDITKLISKEFPSSKNVIIGNAREAVLYVKTHTPDKIILDMSLPSHPPNVGEGSSVPMPNGGMEIILTLRRQKKITIPIAILTQYEDIEINSEYYSVESASEVIKERYGIEVLTTAHYVRGSTAWESIIREFLRQ